MKTTIISFLFLVGGFIAAFAGEIGIGSKSLAVIAIPDSFYYENEDENTIFAMPRKNDPHGPISMEVSCLRDLSEAQLSPKQVEELLNRLNPKSSLLHMGSNLATTQADDGKDDQGLDWRYVHYAVYADKLLITVTVSTMKGREKEPQCKELLDQVMRILATLKRKPA